jgi:cell division septation protein DedD
MSRSYYVIELSARWLTVLLIALALVMVIAFALGYGAAWSVLTAELTQGEMTAPQAAATPTEIPEVVIPTSVPTPAAEPTKTSLPSPTATPSPEPTPQPTPTVAVTEFFVQVLASAKQQSVDAARTRLEGLGFASDYQHLITVQDAGAGVLFKLRIGPFPDRSSADRVAQRMSAEGFPDAWVVAP